MLVLAAEIFFAPLLCWNCLRLTYISFDGQSYWEITSDSYLQFIRNYVVGIGPWKDTIVPVVNNYLTMPTDLVVKAHAHNLQVLLIPVDFLAKWSYLFILTILLHQFKTIK
jgi:glycerophosphoryl diester phosphodiesterase